MGSLLYDWGYWIYGLAIEKRIPPPSTPWPQLRPPDTIVSQSFSHVFPSLSLSLPDHWALDIFEPGAEGNGNEGGEGIYGRKLWCDPEASTGQFGLSSEIRGWKGERQVEQFVCCWKRGGTLTPPGLLASETNRSLVSISISPRCSRFPAIIVSHPRAAFSQSGEETRSSSDELGERRRERRRRHSLLRRGLPPTAGLRPGILAQRRLARRPSSTWTGSEWEGMPYKRVRNCKEQTTWSLQCSEVGLEL